jgi:3-oxoacyl-[acyl-carrier protein] reductase
VDAQRHRPSIVPYGSVKAAVSHLVRGLAVELGPSGVRLNGIAPGYVATPMTAAVLEDPERLTTIMGRLPLKRIGAPADMAGPALFLMSDDAAYVTGQILAVDGGYALT